MTVVHTNSTIGSEILDISEELAEAIHNVAANKKRHLMLGKLVHATLKSLENGNGINTAEALLLADMIVYWALKQIAEKNVVRLQTMQQGWALALAFRHDLLPVPEMPEVERSHAADKPS